MTKRIKEKAAHIRRCLKREGINARVRMCPAGKDIQVITPTYDARFTSSDLRIIATIAKGIGLTKQRRVEIDVDHESTLTGGIEIAFEYNADLDREGIQIAAEMAA